MCWLSDEFLIEAYNSRSGGRMAAGAVAGWQQDGSRMQAVLCTGHWAPELRRHGRGERGSKQIVVSCSGVSDNK